MSNAARVGDLQGCPLVGHVGGAIVGPGQPSVVIEGLPAATVGSVAGCIGAITTLTTGSTTVSIGSKQAARKGDATDHGGEITTGAATVVIGD